MAIKLITGYNEYYKVAYHTTFEEATEVPEVEDGEYEWWLNRVKKGEYNKDFEVITNVTEMSLDCSETFEGRAYEVEYLDSAFWDCDLTDEENLEECKRVKYIAISYTEEGEE